MHTVLKGAMVVATLAIATPAGAAVWPEEQPVADTALSAIVGKAALTTRLSTIVNEQGSIQSQFASEDLRITFANWFADGNLQAISNDLIRQGTPTGAG